MKAVLTLFLFLALSIVSIPASAQDEPTQKKHQYQMAVNTETLVALSERQQLILRVPEDHRYRGFLGV